jgi:hypothetical protein
MLWSEYPLPSKSFTDDYYCQFMQDWEARINHYLVHGSALRATGG